MTSRHKFSIKSRIIELRLKKKDLDSQLSKINRDLIYEGGTERKKRAFIKKNKEIQEELNRVETLITEELNKSSEKKKVRTIDMFNTPPANPAGLQTGNVTIEDVTEDIIDRDINIPPTESDTFPQFQTSMAAANTFPPIKSKATSTLPTYDALKRREAEEKNDKLQKELAEFKEKYETMLRNNVLVPSNNQISKRPSQFDSFELKKPPPRRNTDTFGVKARTNQIVYTMTPQNVNNIDNSHENVALQRDELNQTQPQQNAQNQLLRDDFDNPNQIHALMPNINQNYGTLRPSFLRRLKSIPAVKGESYAELRDFIDITDTLFVSIRTNDEEMEFYDQLLLQIRGEARKAIESLDKTEWQAIREKLQTYFAYMANKDIINSKLENLRQEKDENLNQFVERTRKLLQEKNSMYGSLSEEQKKEHNKMARRAFARGVNNAKLRERLQVHGANTLEDAIAYSIETENYISNQVTDREMFCTFCRSTGHRENNCFKKEQSSGPISNLISALRSLNPRQNSNTNIPTNFNSKGGANNWNRNFNLGRNQNLNRNFNPNWANTNRNFNRNINNDRSFNRGYENNRNWNQDRYNNSNQNNFQRNRNNFQRNDFANKNGGGPNTSPQRNNAQNNFLNERRNFQKRNISFAANDFQTDTSSADNSSQSEN